MLVCGSQVTTDEVRTSPTVVRAGSSPPATTRRSTSRSVKIPARSSPSITSTPPIPSSFMRVAARSTVSAGRTEMRVGPFLTRISRTALMETSLEDPPFYARVPPGATTRSGRGACGGHALELDPRSEHQSAGGERAARGQVVREVRHVDLIHRPPVVDVRQHRGAFHHPIQRGAAPLQLGPD